MHITAQHNSPHAPLIAKLYAAVDAMNARNVVEFVTEDVAFRLGNFDPINGRDSVELANDAFFQTIAAMRHTITGLWSGGDTVFCDGTVHYTRKDGSEHEVPFATRLGLEQGKVYDYRVYVDISKL
ncbi:nuclear transport factor 2 family protein [Rhodobacteraceae bacterium B1Z28]|uniref:Nuclear transport factor 2 family protein n=1 Tax=Ruegeria haliotis TaxID=2747601 RepID=A0ABX2PXB9_9RHOB|nr:nuclear transport factor 2 family protein [Ruegeria haliotis]NVO58698.1 nuclear transport factor 2 family protein [Ruegeria haliotis]